MTDPDSAHDADEDDVFDVEIPPDASTPGMVSPSMPDPTNDSTSFDWMDSSIGMKSPSAYWEEVRVQTKFGRKHLHLRMNSVQARNWRDVLVGIRNKRQLDLKNRYTPVDAWEER